MRPRKTFFLPVGGRLIALATVALFVAVFLSYLQFSSIEIVEAQARRQPRKAQSRRATQPRTPFSVSTSFNHEHHRAPHPNLRTKLECDYCHTIPTQTAPDVIAAKTKTSIKGYPYHDSCLDCHRSKTLPLFFRGPTPTICTVCHTRSSPRLTHRDLSPFPKHDEQARDLEFPGFFPHAQRKHKEVECANCHTTDKRGHVPIASNGNEETYTPGAGTFKTSPSGHASCFKCHWEEARPTKDQCAGCHLLNEDFADGDRNELSVNAMKWFKNWPLEWPKRFSLKFNHESKSHVAECVTCHLNTAEMNTLDVLKAEVPIAPCAKCHIQKGTPANLATEMYNEDDDILEGRNNDPASRDGQNTCKGCHTTAIGSMPPPCSHYLLFDDTYFVLEDYPKSAKKIAERCKK